MNSAAQCLGDARRDELLDRTPSAKAITYATDQPGARRRVLGDGRLPMPDAEWGGGLG